MSFDRVNLNGAYTTALTGNLSMIFFPFLKIIDKKYIIFRNYAKQLLNLLLEFLVRPNELLISDD